MPLLTTTITTILSTITKATHHLFSTTTTPTPTPTPTSIPTPLSKIPSKYRPQAIQQAQEAIIDYLHSTRAIPYPYAEKIAKNAFFSLSSIISKVPFHHSSFFSSMRRFLRYHPIDEFDFFYESIGIDYKEVKGFLNVNGLFLCDDLLVFSNVCVLADFGFPWNKLGLLCREKDKVFSKNDAFFSNKDGSFSNADGGFSKKDEIFSNKDVDFRRKLGDLRDCYGFKTVVIVGICLAFPHVLCDGNGECEGLLGDLKRVLVDTDLVEHVGANVDVAYDVCRKIRLFYRLGCKVGEVGELLEMNHKVFVDYAEDDLVRKIEFFCRLGVDKEKVGLLLLLKPEILKYDLEDHVIIVSSFLVHLDLCEQKLKHIERNYPYVLGKNRMVNVPHIMRAIELSDWFFDMMKRGDHSLLATYTSSSNCEDTDDDYGKNLEKILCGKRRVINSSKLDFLHQIGFGENRFTVKVMSNLHGHSSQLYERFNFLLSLGIKFSKLCKMISLSPTILNRNTSVLERKVKFLCEEMSSSLEYLNKFPSYLIYDLENRIKPRYNFHKWLKAQVWYTKEYSISTMIAKSEKNFKATISNVHPDAPKKWFNVMRKRMK